MHRSVHSAMLLSPSYCLDQTWPALLHTIDAPGNYPGDPPSNPRNAHNPSTLQVLPPLSHDNSVLDSPATTHRGLNSRARRKKTTIKGKARKRFKARERSVETGTREALRVEAQAVRVLHDIYSRGFGVAPFGTGCGWFVFTAGGVRTNTVLVHVD